jgi:MFS family permease
MYLDFLSCALSSDGSRTIMLTGQVGPYFGPFLSAFILRSLTWRESWLLVGGFVGLGLLLVIFLMDETAYDRRVAENNPRRPHGFLRYRTYALSGMMGYRMKGRKPISQGFLDIWRVFKQPQFFLLWLVHGVQYSKSTLPSLILSLYFLFHTSSPPSLFSSINNDHPIAVFQVSIVYALALCTQLSSAKRLDGVVRIAIAVHSLEWR